MFILTELSSQSDRSHSSQRNTGSRSGSHSGLISPPDNPGQQSGRTENPNRNQQVPVQPRPSRQPERRFPRRQTSLRFPRDPSPPRISSPPRDPQIPEIRPDSPRSSIGSNNSPEHSPTRTSFITASRNPSSSSSGTYSDDSSWHSWESGP